MTTGKLVANRRWAGLPDGCSGSHNPECRYQPHLVGLWIVPNYLDSKNNQLNTLQTVVPFFTRAW